MKAMAANNWGRQLYGRAPLACVIVARLRRSTSVLLAGHLKPTRLRRTISVLLAGSLETDPVATKITSAPGRKSCHALSPAPRRAQARNATSTPH
eukprot:CAMPEP_0170360048 /NCGR_PEP_ID=MMETSP0117_2-20130122/3073_1 /TAXON_ID=400756 /ORGANISM="Durinskia baltica, Strain CSIRO CS-38" /LENGTH=94 /DNA_ID=CAMNT_0010614337 /DNA_START=223 /DNA_END=505 /DNA_ORIENTATION=+